MQQVQLEAAAIIGKVLLGRNLNQALEESLQRNSGFSAQQRAALQDLSYGTLRHLGRLEFLLHKLLERPLQQILLHRLLLVAIYQLEFSKAGHHAVVDQAVCAAKKRFPHMGGLANAVLRNYLRRSVELLKEADRSEEGRLSYPQWWIDVIRQQYRNQTETLLQAGNEHPPMSLRINRRKTTVAEYQMLLAQQGLTAQKAAFSALVLDKPVPVSLLPKFQEGWVSVQDAGAQYAAHLLDVQDEMRVLDACAAPGGKSAHMLELADIGLVALDKDKKRLARIHENLRRLQLQAQVLLGDAANPGEWWDGKPFHRILADVPCSASGVVSRHPDIKWLRRQKDIGAFAAQQIRILESLWPLLMTGGKLLYATCSVFAKENQQVVDMFLANHADAVRENIEALEGHATRGQLIPAKQHNGFFYALLYKKA